ncbi:MAG: hypothetical protein ACR2P1_01130 [Pseudomonadales bacterium]
MQKMIIAFVALGLPAAVSEAKSDHCFDVLKQGQLFSGQADRNLSQNEKFLNWQCATSFRKHKQALNIGLSVGKLVYDTPLKKRGKWKKSEVMAWKDENCSMKARKTTVGAATFKFISSESPELLTSWANCMTERSATAELSCSIEQTGNLSIFSAMFSGTTDELEAADDSSAIDDPESTIAAVVKSWQVAGGSCHPVLQRGSEIIDVATETSCAADTNANLVVMLETERGSCWQMVETESSRIVIDGKTVLQEKTSYEADVIEFSATAELITNGFDLVISAKKHIKIEGLPKITSFEPDHNRQTGTDGRNAAPVIIRTAAVQGSKLLIVNHGEDGSAGAEGAAGKKGARGSPGRAGADRGMKGCVGRKNGGKGRTGGHGEQGGAGGDAGDGGPVTISLKTKQFSGGYDRFIVSQSRQNPFTNKEYRCKGTCPGTAGPGGAGGEGGEGGSGGSGVRGSWPCGGVSPGTKGKQGKQGQAGKSGKAGQVGSILIL